MSKKKGNISRLLAWLNEPSDLGRYTGDVWEWDEKDRRKRKK